MTQLNKYHPYGALKSEYRLALKSNKNVVILMALQVSGPRPNLLTRFRERKWKTTNKQKTPLGRVAEGNDSG